VTDPGRQGTVVLEVRLDLAGHVNIEHAATELCNLLLFTADRPDRYEVDYVLVTGRQQTTPPTGAPSVMPAPSVDQVDEGLF
jgi:hypothetical protein